MVETATEEKVPLEAKNKPFMVCGFLGVFWNLSYGSEDHLGSTRMVLNEDGEVKEALMYQPYGTVSDVQGISGSRTDPLRQKFTTKEFDEEGDENGAPGIDAYHFGFRVYDPEIGIFLSTDPKDFFWNSYSYNGGDPVNYVDPYGLNPIGITVESVMLDILYLEAVGEQLATDLASIASNFAVSSALTAGLEISSNNITMIGDLSLSEYAYVNYMETVFSNNLPPISLTSNTTTAATQATAATAQNTASNSSMYAMGGIAVGVGSKISPWVAGGAALCLLASQVDLPTLSKQMYADIARIRSKPRGPLGIQYSLRAAIDGDYINVRGGTTFLKKGQVWKYGKNTAKRYSGPDLDWKKAGGPVDYFPEYTGSDMNIRIMEKVKLYGYLATHGTLPPGNRIRR